MSATNFWQESIDTYDLKFYPQFAPNFYHQLNALTVFYCFGILFLVTGFAVRIWRGWNHCWLLRLERTENGEFSLDISRKWRCRAFILFLESQKALT